MPAGAVGAARVNHGAGGETMGSIVLADDDDDLRGVYAPFLRSLGHDVWEATSGLEAIELIQRHRPRLLILDVWMPKCNGFEVLERLRRDPMAAQMKILMLSSLGDADTRLECFEMGAADYLVKGLTLGDFRDRVDHLLAADSDLFPIAARTVIATDANRPDAAPA